MSSKYTAQEMRELAEMIDHGGAFALTDPSIVESNVAMLRQAADAMERDECEKKYEYTAEYIKRRSRKIVCKSEYHFNSLDEAKRINYFPLKNEELRFVRRSVGEWEVVSNG